MKELLPEVFQNRLKNLQVMPVVTVSKPEHGLKLAEVLVAGGFPAAEITFRVEGAAQIIQTIRKAFPELLLGAGTVIRKQQLAAAYDAGVDFAVSPGFNPAIVELAIDLNLPFMPGVNNPGQVEQAMAMGLEVMKFFPAEVSGGVDMVQALQAVYPVRFMPTGGINPSNVVRYLELSSVLVCAGTWLAPQLLIEQENWQQIAVLLAELRLVLESMPLNRSSV